MDSVYHILMCYFNTTSVLILYFGVLFILFFFLQNQQISCILKIQEATTPQISGFPLSLLWCHLKFILICFSFKLWKKKKRYKHTQYSPQDYLSQWTSYHTLEARWQNIETLCVPDFDNILYFCILCLTNTMALLRNRPI